MEGQVQLLASVIASSGDRHRTKPKTMTKFVRSNIDKDFQVWLECQERLNGANAMSPQMAADIAYWALKQAGHKDLAFQLWDRMYEYEFSKDN